MPFEYLLKLDKCPEYSFYSSKDSFEEGAREFFCSVTDRVIQTLFRVSFIFIINSLILISAAKNLLHSGLIEEKVVIIFSPLSK
jgi:hypothetical protein